jgi:hypothetical protein
MSAAPFVGQVLPYLTASQRIEKHFSTRDRLSLNEAKQIALEMKRVEWKT